MPSKDAASSATAFDSETRKDSASSMMLYIRSLTESYFFLLTVNLATIATKAAAVAAEWAEADPPPGEGVPAAMSSNKLLSLVPSSSG